MIPQMPNDAFALLDAIHSAYGFQRVELSEIEKINPDYAQALQWLIDEEYMFFVPLVNYGLVSKTGYSALVQERLARKDALIQAAQKKADQDTEKRMRRRDARRSWWQFILGLIIGWLLGAVTPNQAVTWLKGIMK